MNTPNPKVDGFITRETRWQQEFVRLREIVLDSPLKEELKWGVPCYAFEGKGNVVLIHGFKEYCAILFVKGALLKDPNKVMIIQTENVQSARQIRFTNLQQIIDLEPVIKAYLIEAIEIEKAGLKVEHKTTADFAVSEEFQNKLAMMPEVKTAFEALTPGRQRAYLLFFSTPKQSKTREARVEEYTPKILSGKGLND